jgi:hypothetical protein
MMASFIARLVPITASGGEFWDSKEAMEELSILEQRLPRMRRSLKKTQTSGLRREWCGLVVVGGGGQA